jgi:dCMP deaminase
MNKDRLGWDDYFLEVASSIAARADCTRSKVGAVLVDSNHRIVGTGYNGAPSGIVGCLEGGCPRGKLSYEELPSESDYGNCIAHHAEFNAVIYTDPGKRSGTTIYVTRKPCTGCKKLLLAEHVTRVVWLSSDQAVCQETLFE